MSDVQCPKCQAVSPAGATFCFRCGSSLAGAPPISSPPPASAAPPPFAPTDEAILAGPVAPALTYEARRDIDRTRTGVMLLAIGAALSWIPVIGLLGGLISLAGASS